ncbi:MAG: hypothetical protein KBT39_03285 [Bacteroidales bacterium]|nr:hypothetical protein [Bacteroidales bacterium]
MISVANPIYDTVFKYLMEDERIAKTLLSALLKKEVMEVEVRRHEYTNGSRDKISMFRIDFGATVRQEDGSAKLILIELQKTWLETETLRFRQYLGAQYALPENIIKEDNPEGYAIPMITVYLLGHKVGDIDEPVLYVNHKSFDYDGNEVTKGIPDPFVDSLVHDSIIVQIPRLRGKVNNRLDKVLSVFDQSCKDKYNRQVLNIDEALYADDDEMKHIIHRLLSAASDSALRMEMNVEDEYFSAIENRDTAIMLRDEKIKEQDAQLAEQGAQLAEQGAQLAEQGAQLAEQRKALLLSAKAMKEAGISIEQISVMTTLPTEVILSL